MNWKLGGLIVASALALNGCATPIDWVATGGSRSDGTVRLGYSYGGFEVPQVNEQQAINLANRKCTSWGYTSAEAFGGVLKTCTASNGYGCVAWNVQTEFQCTGAPSQQPLRLVAPVPCQNSDGSGCTPTH